MPCLMCPRSERPHRFAEFPPNVMARGRPRQQGFADKNEQGKLCPARHIGVSVGG